MTGKRTRRSAIRRSSPKTRSLLIGLLFGVTVFVAGTSVAEAAVVDIGTTDGVSVARFQDDGQPDDTEPPAEPEEPDEPAEPTQEPGEVHPAVWFGAGGLLVLAVVWAVNMASGD